MLDQPVAADTVVFGEIGLSGEVRPVSRTDLRLKEAGKLGFTGAFLPAPRKQGGEASGERSPVNLRPIARLDDLVALFDKAGPLLRPARTVG